MHACMHACMHEYMHTYMTGPSTVDDAYDSHVAGFGVDMGEQMTMKMGQPDHYGDGDDGGDEDDADDDAGGGGSWSRL